MPKYFNYEYVAHIKPKVMCHMQENDLEMEKNYEKNPQQNYFYQAKLNTDFKENLLYKKLNRNQDLDFSSPEAVKKSQIDRVR